MKKEKGTIRIIGVVLTMMLTAILMSCGEAVTPQKAINGLNENISFYDALSIYTEEMIKEIEEEDKSTVDYKITIQNGWESSGRLDESDLEEGERAITFWLNITSKGAQETKKYEVKFFMKFDEVRNMVFPYGVYVVNNGYNEEGTISEAVEMVMDIYEYIESVNE